MQVTGRQVAKTALFTAIGAAPGTLWFLNAGPPQSVVIACLGAFVGFALSLPDVSGKRISAGLMAAIVNKTFPFIEMGTVMRSLVGEEVDDEEDEFEKPRDRKV